MLQITKNCNAIAFGLFYRDYSILALMPKKSANVLHQAQILELANCPCFWSNEICRVFIPNSLRLRLTQTLSAPATEEARSCIRSCILHHLMFPNSSSDTSWKKDLHRRSVKHSQSVQ
uniref:Uncharacterized protein MANES_07G045400 n=1 Tax=Rhizophora mucronata TaxID=61149 RepID=A0A2P2MWZ1_RHIMU